MLWAHLEGAKGFWAHLESAKVLWALLEHGGSHQRKLEVETLERRRLVPY